MAGARAGREARHPMRITDEVYQVGGGDYTTPEDAAIYLVRFGETAALVDSGCGNSVGRVLRNIRSCGVDPERVELLLLTHCHYDHAGGASALRDRTGCRIVAHSEDARYLEEGDSKVTAALWYGTKMKPFRVDLKLTRPRERICLGDRFVEAIHVPGHSPGSVVYFVESQGSRVLFAQDVHGPLHPDLLSDRARYQESLALLLSLDADILCEGHFGVFFGRSEAAAFIRSFLER